MNLRGSVRWEVFIEPLVDFPATEQMTSEGFRW